MISFTTLSFFFHFFLPELLPPLAANRAFSLSYFSLLASMFSLFDSTPTPV
jgi:hypothetical protein